MDNKKYLDKVVGSLVRGTDIDYENNRITFPFLFSLPLSSPYSSFSLSSRLIFFLSSSSFLHPFSTYCKNTFGLTEEEVEYVWEEYKSIILDKISNREP